MLHIRQTTVVQQDKLYFTTRTTIRNVHSADLYDVQYLRSVDPDQEQPWTGNFETRNFVRFQPFRAGDPDGFEHPVIAAAALVIASGTNFQDLVCGLGSVHPNARASHFGFNNRDPQLAWTNNAWMGFNETSPKYADEAINLGFKFPLVPSGENVTFSWAYILAENDLEEAMEAMGHIAVLQILQPNNEVSGMIVFAAAVDTSVTSITLSITTSSGSEWFRHTLTQSSLSYIDANGMFVFSATVDTAVHRGLSQHSFKASAILETGEQLEALTLITVNSVGITPSNSTSPTQLETEEYLLCL
jgi:hypothetical protein